MRRVRIGRILREEHKHTFTRRHVRVFKPHAQLMLSIPSNSFTVRSETTLFSATDDPTPTSTGTNLDLVTWNGPDDPTNPKNWSNSYKWILMSLCASMTVNMCVHPDSTIDRKGNDRTWPEHLHRRL